MNQPTTSYYTVTEAQLSAVTKLLASDNKPYWEVTSSKGEGFYTLRDSVRYHALSCNCRAGQEGVPCWHKRAVLQSIAIEADAQAADELAARREAKAVKNDDWKAYERKPFSLLK